MGEILVAGKVAAAVHAAEHVALAALLLVVLLHLVLLHALPARVAAEDNHGSGTVGIYLFMNNPTRPQE